MLAIRLPPLPATSSFRRGHVKYGVIPGITTADEIASDAHNSNLGFVLEHLTLSPEDMDATIINSKGFGGNNVGRCTGSV